jgi:hypothetical protein
MSKSKVLNIIKDEAEAIMKMHPFGYRGRDHHPDDELVCLVILPAKEDGLCQENGPDKDTHHWRILAVYRSEMLSWLADAADQQTAEFIGRCLAAHLDVPIGSK